MLSLKKRWCLPVLLTVLLAPLLWAGSQASKAGGLESIDNTIRQLCPYMEKSPMDGFAQDMDNPKQMKYLILDVLSKMASHAPGALFGYYQYGVAYGLLGPLAALAL